MEHSVGIEAGATVFGIGAMLGETGVISGRITLTLHAPPK
jgi:hypothetical protein